MLLSKGSREDAIHALINTWLKDPRLSCGWCGADFDELNFPCCEKPFVATNAQIFEQFYKELQLDRELSANKHASFKDKSMRLALKMPPGLLGYLTHTFKHLYQEDLFTKEHDINWFLKKFGKKFGVPKEI